jgi:hypothetical protein
MYEHMQTKCFVEYDLLATFGFLSIAYPGWQSANRKHGPFFLILPHIGAANQSARLKLKPI